MIKKKVKERILTKLRLGLIQEFTPEFVEQVQIDETDDFLTSNWLIRLKTDIWSEKLYDELFPVFFSMPKDWFEHLKATLNLPYKEKTIKKMINLQGYRKYPDFPPLPREKYGDSILHEVILQAPPEDEDD